jgi:hypothetical protein
MNVITAKTVGVAALVLALLLPGLASAGGKKIGWNIRHAGMMVEAANAIRSSKSGIAKLNSALRTLNLTDYKQLNNRFKEDIDFAMATNATHVFIAFRGTHNSANDRLNNDGTPVRAYGNRGPWVHKGWWRVAHKAYKHEIRSYLIRHARGKKILVSGHSLGGALAAYTAKLIQDDALFYSNPLRLVTFGAPRYANDPRFFKLGKKVDFWVFTVETVKRNECVDKVVYSWQKALTKRKAPLRLTAPRNKKGDKVWHGRCRSTKTNYEDVHTWKTYYGQSHSSVCYHVKLRRDCKATRSAARWAKN